MKSTHLFSIFFCTLLIGFSTNTHAQWSGQAKKAKGKVITKTLDLETITSIGLGMSATVHLSQGRKQSIKIEGQKDVIDGIKTKTKKAHWNIEFEEDQNYNNYKPIHIYITISDLEYLAIGGSGDIIGKTAFKNIKDLNLSIGGSGNISLEVNAKNIDTSIGGSGTVTLAGSCANFDISIAGSGDVLAYDMKTKDCDVSIAGSGDCKVSSSQNLEVSIVGSGDVYYKGKPEVSSSIIGSGDVERVN